MNEADDLQRTPTYSRTRNIPVPEKDVLDPVAEYNRGELSAMEDIEEFGFSYARDKCDALIDSYKDVDYTQGYADALEVIANREA